MTKRFDRRRHVVTAIEDVEVVGLRAPHLVGADHDRLAVLDERLVALEPVGPGAGETVEVERTGAPELLALQHHLLDSPAKLPRLVCGVKIVRRDEDPKPCSFAARKSRARFSTVLFPLTLSPTNPHETPFSLSTTFCGSMTTTAVSFLWNFISSPWFFGQVRVGLSVELLRSQG